MIKNQIFKKAGLFVTVFSLLFISCSKDEELPEDENNSTLEVVTVEDLDGYTKESVYFSLEQNKEVDENSEEWDIKFTGTTIGFGNGASGQLVEGLMDSYTTAPEDEYSSSDIGGSGTYYTYTNNNEPQHTVLMKPGVLLIVKTGKKNFVKLEMISYYKGNPDMTHPDFADWEEGGLRRQKWPLQHYTFNYVLQPDGTNTF